MSFISDKRVQINGDPVPLETLPLVSGVLAREPLSLSPKLNDSRPVALRLPLRRELLGPNPMTIGLIPEMECDNRGTGKRKGLSGDSSPGKMEVHTMGLFEKLVSLPALRPYMEQDPEVFVEETGWREILQKVRQLKDLEVLLGIVKEASPTTEQQKILRGYLCTMAVEMAPGPLEVPCVDYAGCYLARGEMRMVSSSKEDLPANVGMGMNARSPECRIVVEGDVGDYLAYRSAKACVEVKGSARDRVGMAVGDGYIRIEGDVAGGLAGNAHNTRFEVDGSVGRIQRENSGCKIMIGGDVHWSIGEKQLACFIKICGNVGMKYRKSGKLVDMASGLGRNSVLLVGGDVWGNLGTGMEVAKILVWGKVHGEIRVSDTQGGFIYLNRKKVPLLKRIAGTIGSEIGVRYVELKESGYLFAEDPEEVKDLILS